VALKEYKRKRNFRKTAEPAGAGKRAHRKDKSVNPVFVVHKHQASRLHYDFRLEIGGVLKSWAVPKGPSMNPADKRLAVMVEDHPYDYKDFEGTIPEGEYGAGTVMIWDTGNFQLLDDPAESLQRGELRFVVNGAKLKGGFVLVQTKLGGKKENWLLLKSRDEFADSKSDILVDQPDSAVSGRSLTQIAKDEGHAAD